MFEGQMSRACASFRDRPTGMRMLRVGVDDRADTGSVIIQVSKPSDQEVPVSAVSSSPIPAVSAKLGALNPDDMADLRFFLEAVPDPRSRRGRWYSLASILLACAAAVISGART